LSALTGGVRAASCKRIARSPSKPQDGPDRGTHPGASAATTRPARQKSLKSDIFRGSLEYYRERWNIVDDVHERESYDLRCRRSKLEHHVEVKGTTGSDTAILLSKNEVQHARDFYPNVSLFIVSEVRLEDDQTGPIATGGHIRIIDPWRMTRAG
jgi:Protein NO VEIN, C-terminal